MHLHLLQVIAIGEDSVLHEGQRISHEFRHGLAGFSANKHQFLPFCIIQAQGNDLVSWIFFVKSHFSGCSFQMDLPAQAHTRSIISAMPCPTPMHMVHKAAANRGDRTGPPMSPPAPLQTTLLRPPLRSPRPAGKRIPVPNHIRRRLLCDGR